MTGQDADILREQRDQARAELDRVRAERDQLLVNQLPTTAAPASDVYAELVTLRAHVAALSIRVRDLERELREHRATISWRITAPLRALRRRGRPGLGSSTG